MGLIRSALESAMGANDVKNGFNGPKMPSMSRANNPSTRTYQADYTAGKIDTDEAPLQYSSKYHTSDSSQSDQTTRQLPPYEPPPYPSQTRYPNDVDLYPSQLDRNNVQTGDPESFNRGYSHRQDADYGGRATQRQASGFRPFILPQIDFGDGAPFVRGYSDELGGFGIGPTEFIRVLDSVNVAIIPSPENQIFQKAMGIAGWFVPGAAGLGMMAGQIGVGIGAAYGHASKINKVLSQANLEIFLPRGLEICIGKIKDVDAMVGWSAGSMQQGGSLSGPPGETLTAYGHQIAQVTSILPPLDNVGRSDPIASLGQGLSSRDRQKKAKRAEGRLAKGKSDNRVEKLEYLIVRRATPETMSYWQNTLANCNNASEQGQR